MRLLLARSSLNRPFAVVRLGRVLILLTGLGGVIGLTALAQGTRTPPPAPALPFRIIGYLPDYRWADYDLATAERLTDLIVFSAEPTAEGGLDLKRLDNAPWEKLRAFKTQHRIRLILCVGGWDRSRSFAAVATSADKRTAFANAAVQICLERRLDGVDLDWEHPETPAEQQGYAQLLIELNKAFRPHGLLLSVTMAAWQQVPAAGLAAVDAVQIMAYDHKGRHSTQADAEADVKMVLEKGAAREKIVLGVPFYGRGVTNADQTLTYRQILADLRPAANSDEAGGVYFNGPGTIRRKTEYALKSRLAGVMIWELGQDAAGEQALLKTICDMVENRPSTARKSVP